MFDYPLNGDDSYAELYSLGYKLIYLMGISCRCVGGFLSYCQFFWANH